MKPHAAYFIGCLLMLLVAATCESLSWFFFCAFVAGCLFGFGIVEFLWKLERQREELKRKLGVER